MKHSYSTLTYLLKALIPYTQENLALAFKPGKFFRDLEKISKSSRRAVYQSYVRAKRSGYITDDLVPRLTVKGRLKIAPFEAQVLGTSANLMIIFDIPENASLLRSRLRRLLKSLGFKQVQKSVWVTKYDFREVLIEAVKELELSACVQIYECARLELKG